MQKEQLVEAEKALAVQPETMVVIPTGEGKQVSVFGAHLVSKKLLGIIAHVLASFKDREISLDDDASKEGTEDTGVPIPWGLNAITFRTDGHPKDDFARFNADACSITVNLEEIAKFAIEQVKTDTKDQIHGVMSLNGMYWWLCLDSLLHDMFHAWSCSLDRELVEEDPKVNEEMASNWSTKALIKLAEEVDIKQPALGDEPWFGVKAWAELLQGIHDGEDWAARQQRLIDANLAWGKEGASSEQDERMESFRDYVHAQLAKVDEPWDADVTTIELIENGTGTPISKMMPETDVMQDAEAVSAAQEADRKRAMDVKAANATMPDIETEDLELMQMPEPEGAAEAEIHDETAENLGEQEEDVVIPVVTPEKPEPEAAPEPAPKPAEVITPDAVITADGETFDLDDAMSQVEVPFEDDNMDVPAAAVASGPALSATPATLNTGGVAATPATLTPSSPIQLEDPGLTLEQYETVILGIYDLLCHNIYEKCGWQKVADPATANSPVDFCTLTDPHAVLQPVSLAEILSKVPGSEKILLVMDTLNAEGKWSPDTPIQNGMVKGQVFKNSGLPGYTLTFNVGGTKIKRTIVPQNPNKKYTDTGALKPTAIAARQGSAVCWIMNGARNETGFYYKWNNGSLEKLS